MKKPQLSEIACVLQICQDNPKAIADMKLNLHHCVDIFTRKICDASRFVMHSGTSPQPFLKNVSSYSKSELFYIE